MTFEARYPGRCANCEGQLLGTEVNYQIREERGPNYTPPLVHVHCPEDALEVTREVCETCFCVVAVNGECGCS